MVKKQSSTFAASTRAKLLQTLLDRGNYAEARREAHALVQSADAHEHALAAYALRISWPDTYALLAGAASVVFTLVVMIVVAH